MNRDHEIEGHLLTPARDHLIFPDISGPRRTLSHGLTRFKEDVSCRVTDPKHHGGLLARLGIDSSRKPKKSFGVSDYVMKRKMDSTVKDVSKEEGPSASAEDDDVDEDVKQRLCSFGHSTMIQKNATLLILIV